MPLPNPYEYEDWRDFAAALLLVVGDSVSSAENLLGAIDGSQVVGTIPATSLPPPNPDYTPVYWSFPDQQLFLPDDFTVPPVIITPFQIDTQSLALAAVETNILADNAVVNSKLANLAVNNAKIQDATILNAKIADATILSAKIGDAQIITAKIGDLQVTTAKIGLLAVDTAQIKDAAITTVKIGAAQIGTAQIGTAVITNALMANASIGTAQIINASILTADIANAQITNALIAAATILTANIGSAQITTALIGAAQIVNALIADGTILNAKIADATIQSAKIANLVFDKLTAGTLDAIVDVGTGLVRFTIAGNRLTIGKGFGTSSQFIMWFGPSMAESAMSEASAVFYLKTDGSAYFGGSLLSGTLTSSIQTSDISPTASIELEFGSTGADRVYTVGYSFTADMELTGSGSPTGTSSATIKLERWNGASWDLIDSHTYNGSLELYAPYVSPSIPGLASWSNGGGFTFTDTSGGTTVKLRVRIDGARTDPSYSGSHTGPDISQRLSVQSVEE